MSKLESLVSWAKDHGALIHQDVSFEQTELGVSAIYKGSGQYDNSSNLFQIPQSITLTPTLAEEIFGSDLIPKGNRNALTQLLLAKLRFDPQESKTDSINLSSHFKPYLDILPEGHDTLSPLFWSDVERNTIKGTDAHLAIDYKISQLVDEWYSIVSKIDSKFQPKTFQEDISFYKGFTKGKSEQFWKYLNLPQSWTSFPAYLWASAIFNSRAFPFLLAGNEICRDLNEAFLVPIFDLLNHDNEANVKWDSLDSSNGKNFIFKTEQKLKNGDEIYNSYGPKTNQELMFGYGFAIENNKEDRATLALRIPEANIESANTFGLKLTTNEVSYPITKENPLPTPLIDLFAYLVKSDEETKITLRNRLEGLQQLQKIIQQKIDLLKNLKNEGVENAQIIKIAKIYKNSQKVFYQLTFEEITKQEKSLLKKYKPLSFKSIYKQDKTFANSLLLIFGITDYEQLAKSDDVDRALLLWIIRVGNKPHYTTDKQSLPDWIHKKYQTIASKLSVSREDVIEYKDIYKALFPALETKIPEVYGKGDWSIKSFITAGKVIADISFTRSSNNEIFLIEKIEL
ncbi:hypothetical protein BN7_5343 [Wickerhamomyces ciferrii]|uniref:SET domain-containing protein n=1 Tax=Wickerhamomyces ciferrii (strain ATCC 14091 / BCRC 22168 / CBS 111 / JCM 3599 / NBRC 0793 / NRRL Y-1031 F-60-10) TaxID=1206466 RepID=K0KV51_WICCF|nr:uncharacterized protein BN7_5343 [Wickerhamomyces ciferrii]CCH45757.1 hypothetical protein BN7_5343 [Wickerhamomyces ciferrii]